LKASGVSLSVEKTSQEGGIWIPTPLDRSEYVRPLKERRRQELGKCSKITDRLWKHTGSEEEVEQRKLKSK
jgi:hypothetical protein